VESTKSKTLDARLTDCGRDGGGATAGVADGERPANQVGIDALFTPFQLSQFSLHRCLHLGEVGVPSGAFGGEGFD